MKKNEERQKRVQTFQEKRILIKIMYLIIDPGIYGAEFAE